MLPLELLRCPRCHDSFGTSDPTDDGLACPSCQATYPERDGIVDLTPPGVDDDPSWAVWREHLDAFQRRREQRVADPSGLPAKLSISGGSQQRAFAAFTGIADGVVVDVGCGPGKFRNALPGDVRYIGLDPMPIPEVAGVDLVRGLAEHLPFVDGSVRHVTVLSALDHFNDVGRFVSEAARVLEPGGRLHVIQQVHESHWSPRGMAHAVKDFIEDRATKHSDDVPHHMTEFEESDLRAELEREFRIEREEMFSVSWLAPRRLFLTLRKLEH